MVRGLSWLYLKATGWHIADDWPDLKKAVVVAAPHTSNWDGLTMLAVAGWYRSKLSWMGKASLVTGPLGSLMRRAGCVPVDRKSSNDVVEQMAEAFATRDSLVLAVAPEGTRDANAKWKSGFYHIAHAADVPLVMAVLDYKTRILGVTQPFKTTGNYGVDMRTILGYYDGVEGKKPEKFVKPDLDAL